MNSNEWKVTTNFVCGEYMYRVYRVKNPAEVDHSGNREYYGDYTAIKAEAQALADRLNAQKKTSPDSLATKDEA